MKKNASSKKQNLEDLSLSDGKNIVDQDIEKIKELEKILGIKTVNPFGTYNLDIFKEKLKDMTALDMRHLCDRVGIFASGSRQELREKLLREFRSSCRGTISITKESPSTKLDPNDPLHKETLRILGEI